jgi:hypothetical protein
MMAAECVSTLYLQHNIRHGFGHGKPQHALLQLPELGQSVVCNADAKDTVYCLPVPATVVTHHHPSSLCALPLAWVAA